MKKTISLIAFTAIFICTFPSCATVLGGPVSECQRTKPAAGQPARKMRAGAFIADLVLLPVIGLIVDFSTHAIYKPCEIDSTKK